MRSHQDGQDMTRVGDMPSLSALDEQKYSEAARGTWNHWNRS
jgi:hypothetical protein